MDKERADALEKASTDAATEGIKALLILNGGACLALLIFMSAVMASSGISPTKAKFTAAASISLPFFAIAAGLSVVTCLFAYKANQAYASNLRYPESYPDHWAIGQRFNRWGVWIAISSLVLFFSGICAFWIRSM
ncbi:hypothetical protein F9L06_10190 [Brucella anthropi]|uniref:Uncharacterized protein n=1 Tax=Brucella anthropi TaxID=529 RepID=A0A6I0DQR3_BRUAN|nr:hypothetical protein [Brucella anthropi]KAB2798964.1 hypothetical protein F9L06_10190 [Brucella anthropi]